MSVTCLNGAICLAVFFLSPKPALPQAPSLPAETSSHFLQAHEEAPILDELRFTGLRPIAPAAVAVQIASHPGDPFDSAIIDKDVRTLARLGWFESIQVEALYSTAPFPLTPEPSVATLNSPHSSCTPSCAISPHGTRSRLGAAEMLSLAMHLNLTVSESSSNTRPTAFRKHESALHKWPFPRKPRFDGFLGRTK